MREIKFENYQKSVPELLKGLDFSFQKKIILKPNLTCYKSFPTTTHVEFVEEIIKYIRKTSQAQIIIAEGSGGSSTEECFQKLGYYELTGKYNISLLDLNKAQLKRIKKPNFKKFDFINYPKELLGGYLISLPVLKEHSEAQVTISLKNMVGCYPSQDKKTNWKRKMHEKHISYAIYDIINCRYPDLTICDASFAQLKHEVRGISKKFDLLLAGDPLEVDKRGAAILGYNWQEIQHLVFINDL